MKRILLRSGKSPFRVASREELMQQDLIGTNSGNILFSDAAHKLLLTERTEVTSNGIRTDCIVGCPSMFLYGGTFPVPREPGPFTAESRIAINLSPQAMKVGNIGAIARHSYQRFPNLMYYAQNLADAELLYWGDTSQESGGHQPFPRQLSHPLLETRSAADRRIDEIAGRNEELHRQLLCIQKQLAATQRRLSDEGRLSLPVGPAIRRRIARIKPGASAP